MPDPTSPIQLEPDVGVPTGAPSVNDPGGDAHVPATAAAAEAEALAEEQATVEEAATRPAAGRRQSREGRDRGLLLAGLTLVVLLVVGWMGGTALVQLRRDVGSLSDRLDTAEASLNRAERSRAVSAVARARADLREADALLPDDLAVQVRLAEQTLQRVEAQLDNSR